MRVALLCLFLSLSLQAQGDASRPQGQRFSATLGTLPMAQLVYPGCWDGLLLSVTAPQPKPLQRKQQGATVEVWDIELQESPRQEVFRLFLGSLRQRLSRALAAPPASHGQTDLALLAGCVATKGEASGVDMLIVQSMQDRFNRPPPPRLRR